MISSSHWTPRHFTIPGVKRQVGDAGDDAATSLRRADGGCVLIVADGVGSSSAGALGATLAVQHLAAFLGTVEPTAEGVRRAVERAREAWAAHCLSEVAELRSCSTTVGLAVVTSQSIVMAAVGDCFGVVRRRGQASQSHHLLLDQGKPDNGRSFNETESLAASDWSEGLRVHMVADPEIDGVMVSTDGLEDAVIDYRSAPSLGSDRGAPNLYAHGVHAGAGPAIIASASRFTGASIAQALIDEGDVLRQKQDDIGVAVAVRG